MLQKPQLKHGLKLKVEVTDEYLQKAKKNKATDKYNEKWQAYTQSISTSKPSKLFFAFFSVLPAISQILTLYTTSYSIKSCYQTDAVDSETKNSLKYSQCISLNNESIYFESDDIDLKIMTIACYIMYGLLYLILARIIIEIFMQSKDIVKMLGIGVRITKIFTPQEMFFIFLNLTIFLGIGGYLRYASHDWSLYETVSDWNGTGTTAYVYFEVAKTSTSGIIEAVQLVLIFSCFFSIIFKVYRDPCSFYINLNEFLHSGDINGWSFNNVNYVIENPRALDVIREFFRLYGKQEKEITILFGALEYLKECDAVVITKERNQADNGAVSKSGEIVL